MGPFFLFLFPFRILYTCIFYFYIPFYSPPIHLPLNMVQSETIVYIFGIKSHHLSHPLYKCHMGIFPFPDHFLCWFHQLLFHSLYCPLFHVSFLSLSLLFLYLFFCPLCGHL